jgi:hypothetical protein
LDRYAEDQIAQETGISRSIWVYLDLLAKERKEIGRLARETERGPRSRIRGTTRLRQRPSVFDVGEELRAGRSYLQRRDGRVVNDTIRIYDTIVYMMSPHSLYVDVQIGGRHLDLWHLHHLRQLAHPLPQAIQLQTFDHISPEVSRSF